MKLKKTKTTETFVRYLFQKPQRYELICLFCFFIIIYLVISYYYPDPITINDSGNYILCAKNMKPGGYRPIGYSWFLNFLHSFSETTSAVVFFQLWFYFLAIVLFLFTIKYFYRPKNNWLSYLLTVFVALNPSIIYLSNFIISDSIFITLTLFWVTSAIWMINRKNFYFFLVLHLIALYYLLNVRFIGLVFPVISTIFFIINLKWRGVIVSALSLFVLIYVITSTKKDSREILGVDSFSGFAGWQLANNVLHLKPYISLTPEEIDDPELKFVHAVVMQTPDSLFPKNKLITGFMWAKNMPLKRAFFEMVKTRQWNYLRGWIMMGDIYKKYGYLIIKKHPWLFIKHYLLPNIKLIFLPYTEVFDTYTKIKPDKISIEYYHIENETYKDPKKDIFALYIAPINFISTVVKWIFVFAALIFAFIKRKHIKLDVVQRNIFFFMLCFGVLYLAANVWAAPIVLRYILPISMIQITTIYIILNNYKASKSVTTTK